MSTVTHITAENLTTNDTTYVDALQGVVLAVTVGGYDDDIVFVKLEDANGERDLRFKVGQEVPVLS